MFRFGPTRTHRRGVALSNPESTTSSQPMAIPRFIHFSYVDHARDHKLASCQTLRSPKEQKPMHASIAGRISAVDFPTTY